MPRSIGWFEALTKKAQKEYIASHPNSKYAKGAKAVGVKVQAAVKVTPDMVVRNKASLSIQIQIDKLRDRLEDSPPSMKAAIRNKIQVLRTNLKEVKALTAKSPIVKKIDDHNKKRDADKNKVIAKTPSAKPPKRLISSSDLQREQANAVRLKVSAINKQIEAYQKRLVNSPPSAKVLIRGKIKVLNAKIKALKKPPAVKKPSAKTTSIRLAAIKAKK